MRAIASICRPERASKSSPVWPYTSQHAIFCCSDAVPRRVSQHQRELLTESRRRELTLRQLWEVIGRASACERACFPSPHLPLAATRVVVGPSLHTGL